MPNPLPRTRVAVRRRRKVKVVPKKTPIRQRNTSHKIRKTHRRSVLSNQRFSGLLVLLGSLLILGGVATYNATDQLPVSTPLDRIETNSLNPNFIPHQLTISTLIDIPIIIGDYIDEKWTDSQDAAVYYAGSATPFSKGNIIIYAHDTANLFGKLDQVETGTIIALRLADDSIRQYQVSEIQEVEPQNTQPLQPTSDERLTLYTSSGWLDSKRLVITAVPTAPADLELSKTI